MTLALLETSSSLDAVEAIIREVERGDPEQRWSIAEARKLAKDLNPDFPGIEHELDSHLRRVFPSELVEAAKEYLTQPPSTPVRITRGDVAPPAPFERVQPALRAEPSLHTARAGETTGAAANRAYRERVGATAAFQSMSPRAQRVVGIGLTKFGDTPLWWSVEDTWLPLYNRKTPDDQISLSTMWRAIREAVTTGVLLRLDNPGYKTSQYVVNPDIWH